jgi:hypothetical protein
MVSREKKPRNQSAKPKHTANRIESRLPLLPNWIVVSHRMKPQGHLHARNKSNGDKNRQADLDLSERLHARRPNDPSSATRPTGRYDCKPRRHAGFAAAHG